MKYNLSEIMHKAWKLYRKGVSSFAEALHRAWNSAKAAPVNAQRISEAQNAAGISEPVNTWAGWKAAGYMVEHGANSGNSPMPSKRSLAASSAKRMPPTAR